MWWIGKTVVVVEVVVDDDDEGWRKGALRGDRGSVVRSL